MPRMPSEKPQLVAIAWYSREDFDHVRALGKDGGGLQATFDEWLREAQGVVARCAAQGLVVERVPVNSGDLAAWLTSNNVESSEQTRARFVHDLASAKYGDKH